MSKPINAVETRGNGYRCDCCARTWRDEDWIPKEEMIPFEDVYDRAVSIDPSHVYAVVGLQYYDEAGNGLYGFSTMYTRDTLQVSLYIGDDDYVIKDERQTYLSKDEAIEQFHAWEQTKGDDES